MKTLISFLLLLASSPTMGSSLVGEWVSCDPGRDGVDIEHHLIFGKNNVEFEINAFIDRDKNTGIPCKGKHGILLGTYWHYEEENSQFTSTAFSHYMILYKKLAISEFNKNKICGESNWELGKRLDCTDDKYLGDELAPRGKKTRHEFILKGNELHIIDDGETIIYTKIKK